MLRKKREPNFALAFVNAVTTATGLAFRPKTAGDLKRTFGPEDILQYFYALAHSPSYRERYADFLRADFPRFPLTSSKVLFRSLCTFGAELVQLHLMRKTIPLITTYPVEGSNKVSRVAFLLKQEGDEIGRVIINDTQFFDSVPADVWGYHIGGYRVAESWLKYRKNTVLAYDDLVHYQRVVALIAETMALQIRIDEAIENDGGWPLE